jgi:hypothetical protein
MREEDGEGSSDGECWLKWSAGCERVGRGGAEALATRMKMMRWRWWRRATLAWMARSCEPVSGARRRRWRVG